MLHNFNSISFAFKTSAEQYLNTWFKTHYSKNWLLPVDYYNYLKTPNDYGAQAYITAQENKNYTLEYANAMAQKQVEINQLTQQLCDDELNDLLLRGVIAPAGASVR